MDTSRSKESIFHVLTRKKTFEEEDGTGKEKLKRVLNVFDLTALGIGATLGSGVYVLAGTVAKTIAGPAVVLSFIIAAIVSSFSGVCYAEFAGRVPKAGSAYIYSYVTVGEFIAFVIGWNMLIEHTIGTASVAKAMTNYVDSLLGDPQKSFMKKHFAMHTGFLGEYPDIASFFFIMIIAYIVASGVRKTSTLNNIFTVLNLFTVGIVVISGLFFVKTSNWFIPKNSIPPEVDGGNGGFFPFGWTGIITGAARCVMATVLCISVVNIDYFGDSYKILLTIIIYFSAGILLISTFMLHRLPQAVESLAFKVPMVPFVPCLSIILNLYLMMELNVKTWIRFGSWLFVGLVIYAIYGVQYSVEGLKQRSIEEENYGKKPKISD